MKKIRILFVFLTCLLQVWVLNAQDEDTLIVYGGYTTRTAYEIKAVSGNLDTTTKAKTSISHYDKNGNKIEYRPYRNDSTPLSFHIYTYDSSGNMINEKIQGTDGTVYTEYFLHYDKKGRLTGKSRKFNGDYMDWSVYAAEYEDNCLTNERTYYEYGRLNTSKVYYYDSDHRRTIGKCFTDFGVHYATFYYKYDDNGRLSEVGFKNSDSVYHKSKSIKYDAQGKVISRENIYWENETPPFSEEYTYDTTGTKIEEIKYLAGGPSGCSKQTFKYDALGNIIEIFNYDESNSLVSKKEYIFSK